MADLAMRPPLRAAVALAAALLAAGCGTTTLTPAMPSAQPDIAESWPADAGVPQAAPAQAYDDWRAFVREPRLAALIGRALDHNRDLRLAVLNVERARAQYAIARAELTPAVGASVSANRSGGHAGADAGNLYSVGVGLAGWELDLFGRVRSLGDSALARYLALEATQRAARLALVAEAANAWFALAADGEALDIARATLATHEQSLALARKQHDIGVISGLNLAQIQTQVEAARTDLARYNARIAQGRSALALLAGGALEAALLPAALDDRSVGWVALPAGLPSAVLLRRPDVAAAEQQLRAANANIGAARAAFFPTIRLTASTGLVSSDLEGLFSDGRFAWNFAPSLTVPLFYGDRLNANLQVAQVDRDAALAGYEKAIQLGFKEVADALALSSTLGQQLQAQQALVAAAARAEQLSRARWKAGFDSYLTLLDAQRSLYAAQQGLVALRQAVQANRVALYKAVGGGLQGV